MTMWYRQNDALGNEADIVVTILLQFFLMPELSYLREMIYQGGRNKWNQNKPGDFECICRGFGNQYLLSITESFWIQRELLMIFSKDFVCGEEFF